MALCIENAIFLLPYHLFDPDMIARVRWGSFVLIDLLIPTVIFTANLIDTWSHFIYKALIYDNVLPKEAQSYIHNCQGCGYKLILALAQRFHYKLSTDKALYLIQPSQYWEEAFDDYVLRVFFYFDYAAWLQNNVNDLNDTLIQDVFIQNMYDS